VEFRTVFGGGLRGGEVWVISYAAAARTSTMLSMIFGGSGAAPGVTEMVERQSAARRAASASAKDGGCLRAYQGVDTHVGLEPWTVMYQSHTAL
jgi:hypothetical protein